MLKALAVLALLCIADGALTHYALATYPGIARELSPLPAWLFSIDLTFGSTVRLVAVGVMLWLLWRAWSAGTHPRFTNVVVGLIVAMETFAVVVNGLQLLVVSSGL